MSKVPQRWAHCGGPPGIHGLGLEMQSWGFGEALPRVRKSCENSPTSPQQKGLPREIVDAHPWICGWDG